MITGMVDSRLMAALIKAGWFPTICTIKQRDNTNQEASGQVKHGEAYVAVDGLSNIPCRKVPIILMRPTGTEQRTDRGTAAVTQFQVLFPAYYPQITSAMVVDVDGVLFNILSPESDGQGMMTRLRVERMIPFGD